MNNIRIGQGWDIHRLVENRPFILGNTEIDSDQGPEAHSDGDALLHALIDALFGAAALGDIGYHFPPSDERWKDADSMELLQRCLKLIAEADFSIINIDTSIILQKPRLAPYIPKIREKLAEATSLPLDRISVKAKSKEGLDAVGAGKAVEAQAVVLLEKHDPTLWL